MGGGQNALTLVLQAAQAEVLNVIEGGMVAGVIAHEGKVQPGQAGFQEDGHIGAAGHQAVRLDHHRVGYRAAGGRHSFHQPGIARAGLEHEALAAGAAGLQVDDDRHLLGPGVLIHKALRADRVAFLGVREQEDDWVAVRLWGCAQDAGSLQQGGHAGGIISDARPGIDRVVMGDQHDGRAAQRSIQAGQHVLHGDAVGADAARRAAGGGLLHLGGITQCHQARLQALEHLVVGDAAGWVGRAILAKDGFQIIEGAVS